MNDLTFRAVVSRAIAAFMLAILVAACGGGGASPGNCTTIDPNRSASLPGCVSSTPVLPSNPSQIAFVSATPQNLALIGTGGPGRQETSTVIFKVLNSSSVAVPGVAVDFTLFGLPTGAATGGITLTPASAVSGSDGTVMTVIAAGTVNTPVRVLATLHGSAPVVSAVSDELVVSTGIPDQNGMSLSTETYNVEGAAHDGCAGPVGSIVRVSLSDHFRNPVPDGTAVSFTAEGGAIGASCRTGLISSITNGVETFTKGVPGVCTVNFCSASPRATDGRITIMAYALGEESYTENSALPFSINRYDLGELFDDLCEPFRDDAALMFADTTVKDSKLTACPFPAASEVYIDTNGDGRYNAIGDGLYNGVLNVDPATGKTLANNRSPTVHVRRSLVQVLSTSSAAISAVSATPLVLDKCIDGVPFVNAPVPFTVAVRDLNPTIFPGNTLAGNILPAGTVISIQVNNGVIVGGDSSYTVANSNDTSQLNWYRTVLVRSDATQSSATAVPPLACTDTTKSGLLNVRVVSPIGVVTTSSYTVND
jgi:hypothetical protein